MIDISFTRGIVMNLNQTLSMKLLLQLLLLCVVGDASDWLCSELEHRLEKSLEEKCGKVWQRCHTNKEVQRIRMLHVETFVRQFGGEGSLENCEISHKHRHSPDDPKEGALCSDAKTIESQTQLHTCSHSASSQVFDAIQDLNSVKIISDKLCKALTTVGTVCFKHLQGCFTQDKVNAMRQNHLEQMKAFFLRISHDDAKTRVLKIVK
eukprot:TRINITY_DN9771_c0_g1_i1.p1 TRINITY_DN9771_c0_g1~~TRINITY_DN9771_c0_g1_i1.p1  ORF type:complete len:208 (-),score=36.46 TRINITY_DN9771_c0_g1_i1:255-878(-)